MRQMLRLQRATSRSLLLLFPKAEEALKARRRWFLHRNTLLSVIPEEAGHQEAVRNRDARRIAGIDFDIQRDLKTALQINVEFVSAALLHLFH